MDYRQLVARARTRAVDWWTELRPSQRIFAVAAGVALLISVAGFVVWANQPDLAPVFTGLAEGDAAAISAKLKESKTPYQLADNGATVLVARDKVAEIRLQLASQGLPQAGVVGFEVFDRTNLGLTDFAQHLNYQRGLEGELTRTIGKMTGVEQARVHIVIPKPTLYADKEKPATASVVLKLKPGVKLTPKQVQGVAHLVASGVEGLNPENVTIVDVSGNVLSEPSDELGAGGVVRGTAAQLELQRAFEKSTERDLLAMLDRIVGPNRAAVRVNAALDWTRLEAQSELFAPRDAPTPAVRSSKEASERYLGGAPGAGGVPGVSSNVGGAPSYSTAPRPAGTPTAPGDYERREVTNNYELSKTVQKSVQAPGGIKRLSVSVVLDNVQDNAQLETITKTIETAAGIDPARGDRLAVSSLAFDRTGADELRRAFDEQAQWDSYVSMAKTGTPAVVLLLFLAFFLVARRRGRTTVEVLPAGAALALATGGDGGLAIVAGTPVPTAARLNEVAAQERRRRQAILTEVVGVAKEQPRVVANIIQGWLDE